MTTAREETTRLADLLRREHLALAEFIVALASFDRERRWLELGHASLFYFLHRELGLSKGAAYYRKTAADLVQRYPEVLDGLREGKLCLTSVVELSKVLTPENRAEILPRFFHASKREAKEIAAEILPMPAPPLRTVVTPVRPDVAEPALALAAASSDGDRCAADSVHPANRTRANPFVPGGAPAPSRPPRPESAKVQPLTAELSRIHVTVPRRLLDKLAAARDALSHSHPGASEEEILEGGLDLILQRHAKRRGLGAKPRTASAAASPARVATAPAKDAPPPPSRGRSRHVPAAVWRGVWERDHGCCAWLLDGGGVCGSTHQLELDHVKGWALGAGTTIDECRILCRPHQDVAAVQAGTWVTFVWTRSPALRERPDESLHAAEGWALLRARRGLRRAWHLALESPDLVVTR